MGTDLQCIASECELRGIPHVFVTSGVMAELQPDTELTLFHGTDETEAKTFLAKGIDATKAHARTHNQGTERGLYVTPSIKCALSFGRIVFAVRVKAKSLFPTARWSFGSGRKTQVVKEMAQERYPNSFRPIVSLQLHEKVEPQAMFLGYIPATDIVAVYVFSVTGRDFEKLSVADARKRFGAGNRHVWTGTESAEDVLQTIMDEHGLERDELLDILGRDEEQTFMTLKNMGLPRKLVLRVWSALRSQHVAASIGDVDWDGRWDKHRAAFLSEEGNPEFADSAAIQRCVSEAIRRSDYVIWPPADEDVDRYEAFDALPKRAVIYLNYGDDSDPVFGMPGDDDGERAILVSDPKGIRLVNVQ